jgi:hypothetical protein
MHSREWWSSAWVNCLNFGCARTNYYRAV